MTGYLYSLTSLQEASASVGQPALISPITTIGALCQGKAKPAAFTIVGMDGKGGITANRWPFQVWL